MKFANRIASGDDSQLMEFVLTKPKCWSYEREWRLIHEQRRIEFGYRRSSLKAVYFGTRMPPGQIEMISALLERTDTKLFKMSITKDGFRMEADEVEFVRADYRADQ